MYCVSLLPQECTAQAGRTKGSQNPWFECASFFVHSTGMTEQAKPMMATSEGDSRCPIERRSKRHSVDDFKGHHSSIVWAVQDPMFSKHHNIKTWKYSSPKTLQVVVQKHHRSYIQLPEAFNFVSYSCHFGFINYFHDFLFQTKHRKRTGWPGLVRSQEWILARTLYWYQLRTQALPLVLFSLGWGKMHSFHIYVAQQNYVCHIFENLNW